jgi:hypothetical protein
LEAAVRIKELRLLVVLFSLTLACAPGTAQKSETLGAVKQKYLKKEVTLIGPEMDVETALPVLSAWFVGSESSGYYHADLETQLPASYKGKVAVVVAIQLHDEPSNGERTNALGEPINLDNTVNPYLDLVVKFDDGKVAMGTAYPSTISDEMRFASEQNALAEELAVKLPSIVGKPAFACSYSQLYQSSSTLDELLGAHSKQKEIEDVPYLTPLKISAAKYYQALDAVVLKVIMPDGTEALTISSGEQLTDKSQPFVDRVSGFLLGEIPKKFTPREIAAIKKQTIFHGMSRDALYCAMGFPASTNDWGRGGKQLVYSSTLMVYLDNQKNVVDWQSLEDK